MSFGDDLLVILSSYSGGYRLMRARMHGYTGPATFARRSTKEVSDAVLRVTLSRLKRRGLIARERGAWSITEKGKSYIQEKLKFFRRYAGNAHHAKKPKNMIIAFDIPESERRIRAWLRAELVGLGFEMLQKSVWFGPAPLPQDFIHALGNLDVLRHLKFFKAQEYDVI